MLVPEEAFVEIYFNGKKIAGLMCTSSDLKNLAVGYLCNTGKINSIDEIEDIICCEDLKLVNVKAYKKHDTKIISEDIIQTGCSASNTYLEVKSKLKSLLFDGKMSLDKIVQAYDTMQKQAIKYHKHGAIHSAAIISKDEVITVEDIARHNAVDKAIGKALMLNFNLQQIAIITSGRISTDMVIKSLLSKVPIIGSRSKPTSLALELAQEYNLTVIGMLKGKSPTVYTHSNRLE